MAEGALVEELGALVDLLELELVLGALVELELEAAPIKAKNRTVLGFYDIC
jgi:hypothetical protein